MSPEESFDDLTSAEKGDWLTRDPEGYFVAANLWARNVVEREANQQARRRAAADRERLAAQFRSLRHRLFGGSR